MSKKGPSPQCWFPFWTLLVGSEWMYGCMDVQMDKELIEYLVSFPSWCLTQSVVNRFQEMYIDVCIISILYYSSTLTWHWHDAAGWQSACVISSMMGLMMTWALFQYKDHLSRRSLDRLIFMMGTLYTDRWYVYIEADPRGLFQFQDVHCFTQYCRFSSAFGHQCHLTSKANLHVETLKLKRNG